MTQADYDKKAQARFLRAIVFSETGCHVWQKSCDDQGYPQMGYSFSGPKTQKAHLIAWRWAYGPVPFGAMLKRTCAESRCVNPQHFRVADLEEQTAAAFAAQARPTRELDRERFTKYMATSHVNGCIYWTGHSQTAGGYGTFWLDRKNTPAHRASYILFKGPIPEGYVVLHACDDRQCVNPHHLSVGTSKDNSEDMVKKGRSRFGTLNNRVKLNEQIVLAIRAEYVSGRRGELSRLADKYLVTLQNIKCIVDGKTWKHVVDPNA